MTETILKLDLLSASKALASLGHETRLQIFKLLVEKAPQSYTVGELKELLAIPGTTLNFHLKELAAVNLIEQWQESRYVHCKANISSMNQLLQFLTDNCCQGNPCHDC